MASICSAAAVDITLIAFLLFLIGFPVTAQDAVAPSPEMDTGAGLSLPVSGTFIVSSVIMSLSGYFWW